MKALTPPERTIMRRTLAGFFNNDPGEGDLSGELYVMGFDHDEVRSVTGPAQDLWDALHGLKTEPFDSAYLDNAFKARAELSCSLYRLFGEWDLT